MQRHMRFNQQSSDNKMAKQKIKCEFNFLTHNYTANDIPKDLTELSHNDFTIDNDFLRGQPAYISKKTGMIYIEAFEDTVYIPFERPEYIDALTRRGLFGFDYFLPKSQ